MYFLRPVRDNFFEIHSTGLVGSPIQFPLYLNISYVKDIVSLSFLRCVIGGSFSFANFISASLGRFRAAFLGY
jgi:hypothetical protein